MLVHVFPGQGSQYLGMGAALFDAVPQFLEIEHELDAFLGYSVRRLCLEDTHSLLNQTRYTQAALYVVNALYHFNTRRAGLIPQAVAGHSLGEYNALLAAGAFDLFTGLRLVKRRGEIMSRIKGGGMLAVIGLEAGSVETVLRDGGFDAIKVANFNAPKQTVVSGPTQKLQEAAAALESAGAKLCMILPVSGPFHSQHMHEAAARFAEFLHGVSFRSPTLTVVSNVTGLPYPPLASADQIRQALVRQLCEPVQWTKTIAWLRQHGATNISELGPGTVLTRLSSQLI